MVWYLQWYRNNCPMRSINLGKHTVVMDNPELHWDGRTDLALHVLIKITEADVERGTERSSEGLDCQ